MEVIAKLLSCRSAGETEKAVDSGDGVFRGVAMRSRI